MLSSRRTQPLVDCLWSWRLRFQDKLYNSDSLLFVLILFYVILLLIIHLWCLYIYENWSWHTYSDSLEQPHSVPMQSHLGSVVLCLASTLRGWVQSSLELLRKLWWKCTTSAEYKTDISAVLTVKSGLDPHMINKLKDGYKSHSGYFLWPCWVSTMYSSLLTAAQKEKVYEVFWRCCWVLGVRNPSRLPMKFEAFVSRISCITLIVFYLL